MTNTGSSIKNSYIELIATQKTLPEAEQNKRIHNANTEQKLIFDTPKEATDFFTSRAMENKSFLAMEVNDKNQATGQLKFSCGNGKLYEGTAKDIHKALQADLQACQPTDINRTRLTDALTAFQRDVLNGNLTVPPMARAENTSETSPTPDQPDTGPH